MKVDDDDPLDFTPFNARSADIAASLELTSTGRNR